MNLDTITDTFKNWLDSVLHIDWLSTTITLLLIVIVTAILAHLFTLFLRKMLKSKRGPLPSASIFVNIGRIAIWAISICVILSTCFNVDVGAAVTALGIGGIAISLGFQDTLSNLIGGLQILMTGLVEPGDRIKVGGHEGTVHDVTWRHTTIVTVRGEHVVIPNSVINSEALIKLASETDVRIDIIITPDPTKDLSDQIALMQKEVSDAINKIAIVNKAPKINATGTTERGYRALLSFEIAPGIKRSDAIDAAMKAISSSAHKASVGKHKSGHSEGLEQRVEESKEKFESVDKSDKADKADASDKPDTSDKTDTSGESDKSNKSDKSAGTL